MKFTKTRLTGKCKVLVAITNYEMIDVSFDPDNPNQEQEIIELAKREFGDIGNKITVVSCDVIEVIVNGNKAIEVPEELSGSYPRKVIQNTFMNHLFSNGGVL